MSGSVSMDGTFRDEEKIASEWVETVFRGEGGHESVSMEAAFRGEGECGSRKAGVQGVLGRLVMSESESESRESTDALLPSWNQVRGLGVV